MSCEESQKYCLHLQIYPIDFDVICGYFTERRVFYAKSLKILTWLIKAMISNGKNEYLREQISDQNYQFFDPCCSLNDLFTYVFIFSLKNVVKIMSDSLLSVTLV